MKHPDVPHHRVDGTPCDLSPLCSPEDLCDCKEKTPAELQLDEGPNGNHFTAGTDPKTTPDEDPVATGWFIVTGEDGLPEGVVDADEIVSEATILAYAMASFSDDPSELERIAAETLARVGSAGFGYVAAAALRIMAEHILEPTLAVTDRLHETGALNFDLRDGLFQAYENAESTLRGQQ